ncbi:MAG: ion transporter, partial [Thermoproteota archaeon]|nr:ion transporter [Thermoproteota archaeon]
VLYMEKKKPSSFSHSRPLSSKRETNHIVSIIRVTVGSRIFDWIITAVILLQAIVLVFEATPELHSFGMAWESSEENIFITTHSLVVIAFIVEAALRLIALYPKPQNYFKDGWNCFDFAIVILSIIPIAGEFSTIARLVRLLRITRLITKSTELRAIVSTLVAQFRAYLTF